MGIILNSHLFLKKNKMLNFSRVFRMLESDLIANWNKHTMREHVASCLVSGSYMLGSNFNSTKTDPFQNRFGRNVESIHLHAEVSAVKSAIKKIGIDKLKDCTMFTLRLKYYDSERKKIVWGLAKPCAGCEMLIREFDISTVVYSINQESRGDFEIMEF